MKHSISNDHDESVFIIAGASGLVGSEVLSYAIQEQAIQTIYTLSRSPLSVKHDKITPLINADLNIQQWDDSAPLPKLGVIALGTTLKQAGSKQALEQVDYELVCHVGQQMKLLGVERLAVVSSLGAHPRSKSHYLRCKGRMEEALRQLGFSHLTFVRPGPLVGERKQIRKDEILLKKLMKIGQYFMFGKMKNFIPIPAKDVARVMLYRLFTEQTKHVEVLDSITMKSILEEYR